MRAAKKALADDVPMMASALAYSAFFAIPSVLLVAVGAFTLLAGPDTIARLIDDLGGAVPADAARLLQDSLEQLRERQGTGVAMTILGLVLALWSTTGAMSTCMTALTIAHERTDTRGFVEKRVRALALVGCIGAAVLVTAGLLVFGPVVEHAVGDALEVQGVLRWAWWVARWPILAVVLLAAFSTVLRLGPDGEPRPRRLVTPGSVVAVVAWLAASGAFAAYTASFGSYDKTWGSLAAVIVTLTWFWLAGIALLLGAEVDAEVERSRR